MLPLWSVVSPLMETQRLSVFQSRLHRAALELSVHSSLCVQVCPEKPVLGGTPSRPEAGMGAGASWMWTVNWGQLQEGGHAPPPVPLLESWI